MLVKVLEGDLVAKTDNMEKKSTFLSPDVVKELEEIANENTVGVSVVIRWAVMDYLKNKKTIDLPSVPHTSSQVD